MKVNRENWNALAIDYYDGNLSEEQEQMLFAFLEEHPLLKMEFETYEEVVLKPEAILFPNGQLLKKPEIIPVGSIHEDNFQHFMVLYLDDELTRTERENLEKFFKKNPGLKAEFSLWKKTKLTADTSLVFEEKETLKKKTRMLPVWFARTLAAAAVLLFGFLVLKPSLNRQTEKPEHRYGNTVFPVLQRTIPFDNEIAVNLCLRKNRKVQYTTVATSATKQEIVFGSLPVTAMKKTGITNIEMAWENKPILLIKPTQMVVPSAGILVVKDESSKNILLKVIKKPFGKIQKLLAQRKRARKHNGNKEPPAVKIIDTGIAAFNVITGADVITARVYNKTGHLTRYQIVGNNWHINRKIDHHGGME